MPQPLHPVGKRHEVRISRHPASLGVECAPHWEQMTLGLTGRSVISITGLRCNLSRVSFDTCLSGPRWVRHCEQTSDAIYRAVDWLARGSFRTSREIREQQFRKTLQ